MKTTLLVRSLLALMLLVAAGCGDWSRRSSRSGLLIEPGDAASLGFSVNWSTDLNIPSRTDLSSATLLDDILFTVESPGNLVTAVSLRDGSILWRRIIGEATENIYPPVRDGDKVYFNNDTTFFTVSALKGDLIATSQLSQVVETGPVLMERYAIFGGANGKVYAHDIDTGYPKWSYQMSGGVITAPVASQQNVFVADSKGIYAALRADSGELVFRGKTFGPVSAGIAHTRNAVFVASHDQSIYALNRVTGQDLWVYRTQTPLTLTPAALNRTVVLPLPGIGTVALDANTGEERWKSDLVLHALAATDSSILVQYDGGMSWIDEQSGRVVTDVQTMPLQTVVPISEGGVLVISPGGRIHRLVTKR